MLSLCWICYCWLGVELVVLKSFKDWASVITILFDIDGTLIRSGGAGMIAIRQVMGEMFGLQNVTKVPVHGRTDKGILGDIFAAVSLDYDEQQSEFTKRYSSLLAQTLAGCDGVILPGVKSLLDELQQLPNVSLGILTGNGQLAAQAKLTHFQLEQYFSFGGYGDDHANRDEIAKLANRSAEQFLKNAYDPSQVWVVGDTVHDITCARSIGARVVAVETGGAGRQELELSLIHI